MESFDCRRSERWRLSTSKNKGAPCAKHERSSNSQPFGIWFRRFEGSDQLPEEADASQILEAYREPIEELKRTGGYVTADVINVKPTTPGLEAMLAKLAANIGRMKTKFALSSTAAAFLHPPQRRPRLFR